MLTDHGRSAHLVMLWGQRGLFITRLPPGHSNCSRLPPPAHQAAILHCQHTFLSSPDLLENQLWCPPWYRGPALRDCSRSGPMGTASMEVARHLLDQVAALYKCRPCFTPMGMAVQAQHGSAAAAAPTSSCFLQAPHGQPLLYQVSAICSPVRLLRRRRVTVSHPCCSRALGL